MSPKNLTYLDPLGTSRLGEGSLTGTPTQRRATSKCRVIMKPETISAVLSNGIVKGDVLSAARIAGIQAAKKTSELIPFCQAVKVGSVYINFTIGDNYIEVESQVEALDNAGVEMEAVFSCSVAALTIYDMCKSYDRGIYIESLALWSKSGGRSGPWHRSDLSGSLNSEQ